MRERRIGVVVELQVDGNRAESLSAGRLHVVDTIGAGNHAFQRGGNETANQVGVRAHVHCRDLHHGDVTARILAHAERADRLQPGDQDHEVDDNREDRALNKKIGELHLAVLRLGRWTVSRLHFVINLNGSAIA